MATATNTTLGQILLSGDLTGTGEAPQLRATGVKGGTYGVTIGAPNSTGVSSVNIPKLIVDSKGRIPFASNTPATLQWQIANSTTNGILKVDGTSITIASGVMTSTTANPPIATASVNGIVKGGGGTTTGVVFDDPGELNYPVFAIASMRSDRRGRWNPDRTTININSSGVASASWLKATSSTIGSVKPDNSTVLVAADGSLSARFPLATTSILGLVKVGSGFSINGAGTLSVTTPIPIATASVLGAVKWGGGFSWTGGDTANLDKATNVNKGVVRVDGTTLSISSGVISSNIVLSPATASATGLVKIGSNISIDGAGTISVAKATSSTIGLVKTGSSINVDGNGTLSVNFFTNKATSSVAGLVKPDNTTITVDVNGILKSTYAIATDVLTFTKMQNFAENRITSSNDLLLGTATGTTSNFIRFHFDGYNKIINARLNAYADGTELTFVISQAIVNDLIYTFNTGNASTYGYFKLCNGLLFNQGTNYLSISSNVANANYLNTTQNLILKILVVTDSNGYKMGLIHRATIV